jgi:hypothetical protein
MICEALRYATNDDAANHATAVAAALNSELI